MQRLPFCLAIALALGAFSVRGEPQEKPSFPPGVKELYERLATSMRTEHMPGFMKLFHISFLYEGEDRASLDRGPWRRLWLERFADRSYEAVSYSPGRTLEAEDSRIVLRVEGVVVYEEAEGGTRRLEKASFEDTVVHGSVVAAV